MSVNQLISSTIDPFEILFRNALRAGYGYQPIGRKPDYPYDVYFNDEFLSIDIPILGGNVDDIKVTHTDDELRVSYHRSDKPDGDVTYLTNSIVRRDFELVWKIPAKFDLENLHANYRGGLFSVQIPWAKKSLPREVKVLDLNYNPVQSELSTQN